MSKFVSETLPAEVRKALNGRDLEGKIGDAYLVVTVDADGTPRPSMLSAGEMLAVDDRTIRLGVWRGTHTAENLRRGGHVLICFVAEGTVLYIKGSSRAVEVASKAPVEVSEVVVSSVESDVHEGLPVVHGIAFRPEDEGRRTAMLAEWERTHEALRQAVT